MVFWSLFPIALIVKTAKQEYSLLHIACKLYSNKKGEIVGKTAENVNVKSNTVTLMLLNSLFKPLTH